MRTFQRAIVFVGALVLPATAFAQASITGTVRDSSGGVLPGVTVEAASPVLIEKVRTTVTDGNGRYELIDLLRASQSRAIVSIDVFNLLNSNAVVNANQNFGAWLRPTQILNARVVKFSVQFDY